MLDGLGKQAGEIGVGKLDPGRQQPGPHRVCIDLALGGLRQVLRLQMGGDVAVHDHTADRQFHLRKLLDGFQCLLHRQRF